MTIQEYIALGETVAKDAAAVLGTVGALASVIAHLPFVPTKWAEVAARFASYAATRSFEVSRKLAGNPEDPKAGT